MATRSQSTYTRRPVHWPSGTGPSARAMASSPNIPKTNDATRWLSAPSPQVGGYSASPAVNTPKSGRQSDLNSTPRSAIYSPQLPSHSQRQRLSLRPSWFRQSSTPVTPTLVGEHEDDGLASEHLDADALSEVIMAIDLNKAGHLGCAYYIVAEEKLFLLEDVPMAGAEIIETLLLHSRPTTVLIPSRTSQVLLDILNKGAGGGDSDDHHGKPANFYNFPPDVTWAILTTSGDWPGAYILRTLTMSEFRYESAREKLLSLGIGSTGRHAMHFMSVMENDPAEDSERRQGSLKGSLMRLATSVNLESMLTIGCAGAVLSDINRRRTAEYLPGEPDALVGFKIGSLEMIKLFDSMFVNTDTLAALQIMSSEAHPNGQVQGPDRSSSGAKESLSVYGLFHYLASTPQGRTKLRRIFLRPSIDIDLIQSRQKAIAFFLRPDHSEDARKLSKELRKIKDMRATITFLKKGVDTPSKKSSMASNVWLTLERFVHNALNVRETLAQMQHSETIQVIKGVVNTIQYRPLHHIGELVARTIDFEQSRERQRTAVKQGIDRDLDELKRRYNGMEDFLTEVNVKLRADIPEWAQRYIQGCIFYPQLGFLTVVSLNPENGNASYEGEGLDDVWERLFADNNVVYCKNHRMKEMDEHFGDAYCMIIDREVEILHQLSTQVLEYEDVILAASDIIGELDSVFALAVGSQKYNWVAPLMCSQNILHIEGGRHPLQELVVPSFVANDCFMSGGNGDQADSPRQDASSIARDDVKIPSTLILTGPNHSGKSVYLKQTALIVYLAHIGCYVPAGRAIIGITDRILTRIATRESVSRNESAFAIDLRQAAFAMNFATRRSLILVDEFGKGTDTVDGAGLMTAFLHHFSELGPERPKLLAATHFHEIFEAGFLVENNELNFVHMDVHVDFETLTMEDQVTYLYQLQPGRNVSSFGSRCAALNGVDEAIVDRAEAIMLLLVRGEDLEAACSKLSTEEALKLEKAEVVARAFLEQDIEPPQLKGKQRGDHYYSMLQSILASCRS